MTYYGQGRLCLEHLFTIELRLQHEFQDDLDLFRCAVDCADQIRPSDAIYVCVVDHAAQELRFVFNYELGKFDYPEMLPFGGGPTSWVARNGSPLEILGDPRPEGLVFQHFGSDVLSSKTQLHLPSFDPESHLVSAVLSVQWHAAVELGDEERLAFRWLALRIGDLVGNRRKRQLAIESEVQKRHRLSRPEMDNLNRGWCERIESYCKLLESGGASASKPDQVVRSLRMMMVETVSGNADNQAPSLLSRKLASLTDRETDVLLLACESLTNAAIAEQLFLGHETVKHHMSNALKKLGFASRRQAVQYAEQIKSGLRSLR